MSPWPRARPTPAALTTSPGFRSRWRSAADSLTPQGYGRVPQPWPRYESSVTRRRIAPPTGEPRAGRGPCDPRSPPPPRGTSNNQGSACDLELHQATRDPRRCDGGRPVTLARTRPSVAAPFAGRGTSGAARVRAANPRQHGGLPIDRRGPGCTSLTRDPTRGGLNTASRAGAGRHLPPYPTRGCGPEGRRRGLPCRLAAPSTPRRAPLSRAVDRGAGGAKRGRVAPRGQPSEAVP